MADVAGIPVSAEVATRIAGSIGPAFEGFAPVAGTLPFDLEPSGCRFHTRCPFAEPLCANATPKLTALDTMGHEAACYMAIPGSGHSRAPGNKNK